ncbi:MAG TPA: hypothetical protein IAC36_07855 [Candidatus Aphodomonas merdavium]|nr:hypothetical protein [Candidatus Aphodomonas merdavium]
MPKKRWGALVLCTLILAHCTGFAQEFFTLPEIRKQAAQGWHETYTDKYGRETAVDIDIQVFGGETAPVLKVGFPEPVEFRLTHNNPYTTVEDVRRKGGGRTHAYRTFGAPADLDTPYGADDGCDLTLREVYAFLDEVLEQEGIDAGDYLYECPELLDVLYNRSQATGEAITPAFYVVDLWPELHGLPVMTHAMLSFQKQGWPIYTPRMSFIMSGRDSYQLYIGTLIEQEMLSEDIPLCPLEQVIAGLEKEIEAGHIQRVFSLNFGYVLYNDPNFPDDTRSAFDAECFYAVPSWVIECAYMGNPEDTFVYDYQALIDKDPDISERTVMGAATITINAQTGEMLDPMDNSKRGLGDADYKGFLRWEDVR